MYDTQIFRSAIYSILSYLLHKRVLKFYCFLGGVFWGAYCGGLAFGGLLVGGLSFWSLLFGKS